jgi:hypothetical protein
VIPIFGAKEYRNMIQVDGFYLYSSGYNIHPLSEMKAADDYQQWVFPLYVALEAVETILNRSIFQIRTSKLAGQKLFGAINGLLGDTSRTEPISTHESYLITSSLTEFEHVLAAELTQMNLWLVVKKRGYDTTDLIEQGWVLFPQDLLQKVPEALTDVASATRCIAFNLPTAAGFHLHRVNESVLHRYYDAVMEGIPRPEGRNMGDYLAKMRENGKGDEKTLSTLKDLKDLHRNPIIHPEDSLENIDEAIALLGSIQAAVVLMLRCIPAPPTTAATGE